MNTAAEPRVGLRNFIFALLVAAIQDCLQRVESAVCRVPSQLRQWLPRNLDP
jgi:hypothetical protein